MPKSVTRKKFSPAIEAAVPKAKRRPRGKPFPKGHSIGLAHRFKKGESGNPHGRPKSAEISKALRKLLASEINLPRIGRTYAEQIVVKWIALGLNGNAAAIAAIADRAEGRPNVSIALNEGQNVAQELIDGMNQLWQQRKDQGALTLPEGAHDEGSETEAGQEAQA